MEEHHHYGPLNALVQESPAAMTSVEEQAPINTALAYACSEMDRVHHQIERLRTRLGPLTQPHDYGALADSATPERPRSEITQAVFSLGGSASDAAEKIIEILNYLDL